jgi:propionate catabolism operon transcriptional regulator
MNHMKHKTQSLGAADRSPGGIIQGGALQGKGRIAPPSDIPSILAVGVSKLGTRFRDVAISLENEARVTLLAKGFDDALQEINAFTDEQVDVIVSAGANGTYIKSRTDFPTVLINVTGSDLLSAVSKARLISSAVGVVAHGQIFPELQQLKEAFGLDLPCSTYVTDNDAESAVLTLRRQGVEVVVGPGSVTTIAEQYGMSAVLLYSDASIRNAFLTAIDLARTRRAELRKRAFMDGILRNLRDGIVALDADGRIQSINAAMFAVLGAEAHGVTGLPLARAFPQVEWDTLLRDGVRAGDVEAIIAIGSRSYLANSRPLLDPSGIAGRLITFFEASQLQRMERSVRSTNTPRQLRARYVLDDLIYDSSALRRVKAYALEYARSGSTVLITGESGTGKELLAQGIHNAGSRSDYPFVAVNCGGFSDSLLESELFGYEDGAFTGARRGGKTGLIEAAHHGTLFLDEIGEMPLGMQTRLLRVIQERQIVRVGAVEPTPVDIRVIAATHRNLLMDVAAGRFREDLFYRLNILRLTLPALRERRDDIWATLRQIIEEFLGPRDGPLCLSRVLEPWRDAFVQYDWPGNVRELRNVAERVSAHFHSPANGAALDVPDLHDIVPEIFATASALSPGPVTLFKHTLTLDVILGVLRECGGNREQACERLGISRSTLWRKLREHRADSPVGPGPAD